MVVQACCGHWGVAFGCQLWGATSRLRCPCAGLITAHGSVIRANLSATASYGPKRQARFMQIGAPSPACTAPMPFPGATQAGGQNRRVTMCSSDIVHKIHTVRIARSGRGPAAAATPGSVIRARCTLRRRSRPRRTALCLGGGEGSGVAGLCWSPGQTWLHQPQPRTAHLTQRFEGGAHCP